MSKTFMVDTKAVSVRLPLDLLNELNTYATDKGMVRSGDANIGGAIIAILKEHFFDVSDNIVRHLSDNVDFEAMIDNAIAPLVARLEALENTPIEALLEDVQKDVNDLTVSFSKDMIAIDERLESLEVIATAKKPLMQLVKEKVLAA